MSGISQTDGRHCEHSTRNDAAGCASLSNQRDKRTQRHIGATEPDGNGGWLTAGSASPELPPIELPLLAEFTGSEFQCPGENKPISAAIHRARLAQGWPACQSCLWNDASPSDETGSTQPRVHRSRRQGIRRTEYGIRGAWLNEIDRWTASFMATVIATHVTQSVNQVEHSSRISHRSFPKPSSTQDPLESTSVITAQPAVIVVGFDHSPGAADIFAGVSSALVKTGSQIVDAGRCTATSLLLCLRKHSAATAAVLVTGSGAASGDIGMDILDRFGRAISVPWRRFGLSAKIHHEPRTSAGRTNTSLSQRTEEFTDARLQAILNNVRPGQRQFSPTATGAAASQPATKRQVSESILFLPESWQRNRQERRTVRHSGHRITVDSERSYRRWLTRWWPQDSSASLCFQVQHPLVADRIQWLAAERRLNLHAELKNAGRSTSRTDPSESSALKQQRNASSTATQQLTAEFTRHAPCVTIHDDDRHFELTTIHGKQLSPERLADWINNSTHALLQHVTAHAASPSRLTLVDVAAPDSGIGQDHIDDALAVSGLILTLMCDKSLPY